MNTEGGREESTVLGIRHAVTTGIKVPPHWVYNLLAETENEQNK